MAKEKISEAPAITAAELADDDYFPVVDRSDTSRSTTGRNKRLAKSELAEAAGLTAHVADTVDAHDASAISYAGSTDLVATTVEAALDELDTEKLSVATASSQFASVARRLVRVPSVDIVGHSYVAGQGASAEANRMANRIATGLGVPLASVGTGGSSLGWQGEWATKHLRAVTPSPTRSANRVHVLMYGINDLNTVGNTDANLLGFRQALRSVISRRRSFLSFEEGDASMTFTGSWSFSADTARNTGTGWQYTTTGTDTYSITTPAWFPGGTVGIRILTRNPASEGAIHTATYGGQTYVRNALNTWGGSPTVAAPCVLRIPNVAPGVQSITVALSSLSTLTAVDGWQVEADSGERPIVAIVKQPTLVDYSAYGSTSPGPPTNTGVANLNTVIDEVVAEFDDYVFSVDTSGINANPSFFDADKLHPNDAGHEYIANQVIAAIASAGFIVGLDY